MCSLSKTTLLAIMLTLGVGVADAVGQDRSVLVEPSYEEPSYEGPNYQEPRYEEPRYEGPGYEEPYNAEPVFEELSLRQPVLQQPVLQAPIQETPFLEAPFLQPIAVDGGYGEITIDPHDSYGIAESQPIPIESYPYSDDTVYLDAGCGMEEVGCGAMPACDCGPVCGCETDYAVPMGGVFQHGVGDVGQSLRQVIGDTSQCDPSAGNEFKPGLLSWANDFCVRNGFAVDSFLLGGGSYFSVDFGIAMTGDRANAIGTLANSIGGFPEFDLKAGSLGRYALGMGSGNRRLELELGFHRNTIDETKSGSGARSLDRFQVDGYRRSTTFMLNGFRDFHNSTFWTPFVKGGVGISHNVSRASVVADINSPAAIAALGLAGASRESTEFPRSGTTQFAWSVGAGVGMDLTERIKFDIEYQFLNAGEAETSVDRFGNAIDFGNGALHELAFGLRFYR